MESTFDYDKTADIVLIEDNATDIMMIRETFKQFAIPNPIIVCHSGTEAIEFLNSTERFPGLVILDLNLPGVTGHEVLERIKSDEALTAIPVVVFTSSRSRQDISRAYQLHANCYVTKPMDFDMFSKAIKTIWEFWLGLVTLPQGGNPKPWTP